jgi:hypothetical protein
LPALAAGTALLVAAAWLTACRLRIRGKAPFGLAVLTIAGAIVIGSTIALSLLGAYEPGAMLLAGVVVLVAVGAWWATGGRPRPDVGELPSLAAVRAAALEHRVVAVMVAAALGATAVELFQGLTIAPGTWDGLMYHLSRVALWIQEGSAFGLDDGTAFQTQHQANGEMLYGWTMLLSDGDRFAALVQLLGAIGCGLAVLWGARELGFSRSASVFAGAVFVTLPQVVVQASSTFVDVPAAMFVGAFALFLIRSIRDRDTGDLTVAALALGVALGIKGTSFLALPGIAILAGAALYAYRPPRRFVLRSLAALAIGTVALGSSKYIENMAEVGSFQGDAVADVTRTEPIPESLGRTLWTFVDAPGFTGTPVQDLLEPGSEYFFDDGTDPGPTYVSEDLVSFGLIGWLVLVPLVLYLVFARSQPVPLRLLALAAILYVVGHAVVVETFHWAPHTLVTGVLLAAPLLAWAAQFGWLRIAMALSAVLLLAPVLFENSKKPLASTWTPGLSRAEQQGFQGEYGDNLARADRLLAPDARIAYVGPRFATWDYPFFGPHFDRYVKRVEATPETPPSPSEVDAWVAEEDLDAIVWSGVDPPAGTEVKRLGKIAASPTVIEYVGDGAPPVLAAAGS